MPFVAINSSPRVSCRVSSCWRRAGVFGSVARSANPVWRAAIASWCTWRRTALSATCCQACTAALDLPSTFEVDGQLGRDLRGLCTIACLQPGADAPVEFLPPSAP